MTKNRYGHDHSHHNLFWSPPHRFICFAFELLVQNKTSKPLDFNVNVDLQSWFLTWPTSPDTVSLNAGLESRQRPNHNHRKSESFWFSRQISILIFARPSPVSCSPWYCRLSSWSTRWFSWFKSCQNANTDKKRLKSFEFQSLFWFFHVKKMSIKKLGKMKNLGKWPPNSSTFESIFANFSFLPGYAWLSSIELTFRVFECPKIVETSAENGREKDLSHFLYSKFSCLERRQKARPTQPS